MKSLYTAAFLAACFLYSAPLAALDYYWVNGSGLWSDYAAHWAKIPNPTLPAHYHANVPTADDDVYFGNTNGGVAYTVTVDAGSPPAPGALVPLAVGTPLTYLGGGMYALDALRRTDKGYWVQVTNGSTDKDLMVGVAAW